MLQHSQISHHKQPYTVHCSLEFAAMSSMSRPCSERGVEQERAPGELKILLQQTLVRQQDWRTQQRSRWCCFFSVLPLLPLWPSCIKSFRCGQPWPKSQFMRRARIRNPWPIPARLTIAGRFGRRVRGCLFWGFKWSV